MITRLFLDTNVLIDLLGERKPYYTSIAKIATLAEKGSIILVVSPLSFATVNYVLSKFENRDVVIEKLRKFRILCEVCMLNDLIIEKGLNSAMPDFEDALQYFSAIDSGCNVIITRNGKDFKKSVLPVMTAEEWLKSLGNYQRL